MYSSTHPKRTICCERRHGAFREIGAGMRKEDQELEELSTQTSWKITVAMAVFALGCLSQFIKLMALPCNAVHANLGLLVHVIYAVYTILGLLVRLASVAAQPRELSVTNRPRRVPSSRRTTPYHVPAMEITITVIAVLLQLSILAYVDLAVIPPSKNHNRRWMYRGIRLSNILLFS
jgi:hypothetical protein